MDNVTVKLTGDTAVVVFHRLMQPGETRQVHPAQAAQLEALYPGRFERVGVRLEEKRGTLPLVVAGHGLVGPDKPTIEIVGDVPDPPVELVMGSDWSIHIKPEPQPEPVAKSARRGAAKSKKS
jgi:hypothetical protein